MFSYNANYPIRSLISTFVAWKALLLLIAVGSNLGPAYDTSSTLIPPYAASFNESAFDLGTRLTRWDAIYFIQVARRGYVFEQEWAFGSGMPMMISLVAKSLEKMGIQGNGSLEPLIGVGLAHVSHLLAVLTLYQLGVKLWKDMRHAFVAALLHILSPAGLFLSAPYQESPFAFLSFFGYSLFSEACLGKSRTVRGDAAIVSAGVVFGLAVTFRSNGLLNGIPFAVYALIELFGFVKMPDVIGLRRLMALGLGGLSVAAGFIVPQAIAYQRFCSEPAGTELRPWCMRRLPGIFAFAQERYWNVGFLRYWTPGNIPLFLLAAPMIYLMMRCSLEMLISYTVGFGKQAAAVRCQSDASILIQAMALSQLILATLAVTSYHIQIITRISSGYPLWYFWLSRCLGDSKTCNFGSGVVVCMVMYAAIQGALFASFLPPA